jgi:hypothetical protein
VSPIANFVGGLATFIVGAAIGAGAYWKYDGPPSAQLRWANKDEAKPVPQPGYSDLVKLDKNHIWTKPTVSVYSTPPAAPRQAPITLKDLTAEAQAHIIDAVFKGAAAPQAALQQLMEAVSGSGGAKKSDPYHVNRVLVATVAKGLDTLPGDRILWTRVFVQPLNFRYADYTIVATDSRSVKIASVEQTTETKLSIKGSADPTGSSMAKPEAGEDFANSQKTTADISEQYENLGVDIQPNFLRIIRESARGGDVVGNSFVQVNMLTDPEMIGCATPDCVSNAIPKLQHTTAQDGAQDDNLVLLVSSSNLTDEKATSHITVLPQTAMPHCALMAHVWMLYEIRHIKSERKNLIEGAQEVELQQDGFDAGPVDIVPADDIAPAVWSIKVTSAPSDGGKPATDDSPDLRAKTLNGADRKLVFTDYTTASELSHWLKTEMAADASNKPGLDKMEFQVTANKTLTPFKHVAEDCKSAGKASPR